MLDKRRLTPLIAALGALALMVGAPAMAQAPADPAPAAADAAAAPADAAPVVEAAPAPADPPTMDNHGGGLTPYLMFMESDPVVKTVMAGLMIAAAFSWVVFILKIFEFNKVNRVSTQFLEAFRSAKTISEMGKIANSEEFEGNPLADMAAAAAQEVELSRQAGLQVNGTHRETTLMRAQSAVGAVQASLGKRMAGGMQFLASLGSGGPFIGLFGTVYGIMNSFIGIANTNTTNLAVVAPGIAEALLATGLGLFAAIPAVMFYNYFQTRISGYGARSEGFISELLNAISRQLDKGA